MSQTFACFMCFELMKMVKKSSLSEAQCVQIVIVHKEGYFERLISARVRQSKNAVQNVIMKFKETGTYSNAKRCG